MTKASDNAYPSVLITEGTEPSAPAAGKQRLYIDSTTHHLKRTDSSGTDVDIESAAANGLASDTLWDAAGDLVQGTGANTAAKLTAGSAGQFLKSAGAAAANLWAYPPGHELDYVEITSPVSIASTTEATPTAVITGNSVTFDGTAVWVEFYTASISNGTAANVDIVTLWLDSTDQGRIAQARAGVSTDRRVPVFARRKLTPSAGSHTLKIQAFGSGGATGTIAAGAGGSGQNVPAYLRVTKA